MQEIKNVLEAEIVEILNTGTMKQLLKLSGIGKKRAEHIMQVSSSPYRSKAIPFPCTDASSGCTYGCTSCLLPLSR